MILAVRRRDGSGVDIHALDEDEARRLIALVRSHGVVVHGELWPPDAIAATVAR